MIIALDFDQTVTEDKQLWKMFVMSARKRNHKIYIVTYRTDNGNNDDIDIFANESGCNGIIYTNGKQKSHCFKADIWIDDQPITIPSYIELTEMANGCEVNNDTVEIL